MRPRELRPAQKRAQPSGRHWGHQRTNAPASGLCQNPWIRKEQSAREAAAKTDADIRGRCRERREEEMAAAKTAAACATGTRPPQLRWHRGRQQAQPADRCDRGSGRRSQPEPRLSSKRMQQAGNNTPRPRAKAAFVRLREWKMSAIGASSRAKSGVEHPDLMIWMSLLFFV